MAVDAHMSDVVLHKLALTLTLLFFYEITACYWSLTLLQVSQRCNNNGLLL